jgi:hypothetical protein
MSVNFDFNDEDVNALEKCLNERWARILEIGGNHLDWWSERLPECELCSLDATRAVTTKYGCTNCVIYKDTGEGNCTGTPYPKAAFGDIEAQQAMYDYLVGLLNRLTN